MGQRFVGHVTLSIKDAGIDHPRGL